MMDNNDRNEKKRDGLVKSEFFTNRKNELNEIIDFLSKDNDTKVLCIHTKNLGGIGKSKLIQTVMDKCKEKYKGRLLCPKSLIDFYHTEARSRMGIMWLIAEAVGDPEIDFKTFYDTYKKIEQETNIEDNAQLAINAEKSFFEEFKSVTNRLNKTIALFFDTYEMIQEAELSRWLEKDFIENLGPRTKIVFSGRKALEHLKPDDYKKMEIKPFDSEHIKEYFLEYFKDEIAMDDIFMNNNFIETISKMSEGRPILLALFADWVTYPPYPLDPSEFIERIEKESESDEDPDKKQKVLFKSKLIKRIADMKNPSDIVVLYMAIVSRRMTHEMLAHLTKKDSDTCKDLLEELEPLSFIKFKPNENSVLLHDEMRDLVVDIWWKSQDPSGNIRRSISENIKNYYDKWLRENKTKSLYHRTIFQAERLHYLLYFDLSGGFETFKKLFKSNFKDNNLDFCELYLFEIKEYDKKFDPSQQLQIDYEEMRLRNEQYHTQKVLDIHSSILKSPEKHKAFEQAPNLKSDISREIGIARLWENDFVEALKDFKSAEKYDRTNKRKRYYSCLIHNWIGYAYYRQGNFFEAERVLLKSERAFLNADPTHYEEAAKNGQYIDISNVYSNINSVYRFSGRFYEGGIYAKMAAYIAKVKKKEREHARFLIAQADTLIMSNRTFDAEKCLETAKAFLQKSPDSLLEARLNITYGVLQSRYVLFYNYILETYLISSEYEKSLEHLKRLTINTPDTNILEVAVNSFENAITILKENEKENEPPKRELADANYFLGATYMISQKWDEAEKCFSECEKVSDSVNNDYWGFQAMVGKLCLFYLQRKTDAFQTQYERCKNESAKTNSQYNNVLGKTAIIRGNFLFDRWLQEANDLDFKEAIRHYILACDYFLKFTRFGKDRFYKAVYVIVKRIGEIPLLKLPSLAELEDLSDIWLYDEESETEVSKQYSALLDRIHHFAIQRKSLQDDPTERQKYSEELREEAQQYIRGGRQLLQRAPMIAKMQLQIEIDSGNPVKIAEAYHWLAYCYSANSADFEVLYHELNSLEMIDTLDENTMTADDIFEAKRLRARIYIRFGATNYRHGQFTKTIESYRSKELEENLDDFLKNKDELDQARDYLMRSKEIIDQCYEEYAQDSEKRETILYTRAHYHFRMAEYLLITQKKSMDDKRIEEIEALYESAIADAAESGNNFRKINAIESWIALYYYCGKWDTMKEKIEDLQLQFQKATEQEYNPIISGRLKMILGHVDYDKLVLIEEDPHDDDDDQLLKETLRRSFTHYIEAARHKHGYSYKNYYETMGVILDRIATLSEKSQKVLKQEILPTLFRRSPRSAEAETAQGLLHSFLQISCDKRYIAKD